MTNVDTKNIVSKYKKFVTINSIVVIVLATILTILLVVLFANGNNVDPMIKSVVGYGAGSTTTVTDKGLAFLGAGIASIGFIGSGVGQGYAAGKATEAVGRNPEATSEIRTTMFIGAAIAETAALYALTIAMILIFVA